MDVCTLEFNTPRVKFVLFKNECKNIFHPRKAVVFFLACTSRKSFLLFFVISAFCSTILCIRLNKLHAKYSTRLQFFFPFASEWVETFFFVELNYVNGFASPHTRNFKTLRNMHMPVSLLVSKTISRPYFHSAFVFWNVSSVLK